MSFKGIHCKLEREYITEVLRKIFEKKDLLKYKYISSHHT